MNRHSKQINAYMKRLEGGIDEVAFWTRPNQKQTLFEQFWVQGQGFSLWDLDFDLLGGFRYWVYFNQKLVQKEFVIDLEQFWRGSMNPDVGSLFTLQVG